MTNDDRPGRKPRSWPSAADGDADRLRETLRRLEDITRLISDWVFETNAEGRLTFVSERVFEAIYRLPAELNGQPFDDIGEFVDDVATKKPGMGRAAFRDRPFLAKARDGSERICLISALPIYDEKSGLFQGMCGTVRDITSERRNAAGMRRLVTAVEELSDAFALWDAEDKLVVANARYRSMHSSIATVLQPGTRFNVVLDAAMAAGLLPESQPNPSQFKALMKERHTASKRGYEMAFGDQSVLLVRECKLPDGGTVTVATDITESRLAQRQIEETAEKHKQFAADVAHELRTPLAGFRSNLDNLGEHAGAQELRDEVDAMARMVEQMLTATRADFLSVQGADVADLSKIAVRVASNMAPLAIKQGRPIEVLGAKQSITVRGDFGSIEQAIRNLVENAMKYGFANTPISIRVNQDKSIRVIDHGPGVPADMQNRVFERFARADQRVQGAGLGLSIVHRIAEAHSATVAVQETQGGGATFIIQFAH